jgi:hypothetical protein
MRFTFIGFPLDSSGTRQTPLNLLGADQRGRPAQHPEVAKGVAYARPSHLPYGRSLMGITTAQPRNRAGASRSEVLDKRKSTGKLYGKPRIFNDLLSSQPLAFNLFGEWQADLGLASRVIETMSGGRFCEVAAVEFEQSPGRSDPRYTGDRSAFDVFIGDTQIHTIASCSSLGGIATSQLRIFHCDIFAIVLLVPRASRPA